MSERMTTTYYHSVLRVSAVLCCAVLLFVGGFIDPATKQMSEVTGGYLMSAVGASASVESTTLNLMTAALTEQRVALEARESALEERELALGLGSVTAERSTDFSSFILSVFLFILLVLIVLNYLLDFLRVSPYATTNSQSDARV